MSSWRVDVNELSGLALASISGGCRQVRSRLPGENDLHTRGFEATSPDIPGLRLDGSNVPHESRILFSPLLVLDQLIDLTSLHPVELGQLIQRRLLLLLFPDLFEKGPLTDRDRYPMSSFPSLFLSEHFRISLAKGEAFVGDGWTSIDRKGTIELRGGDDRLRIVR